MQELIKTRLSTISISVRLVRNAEMHGNNSRKKKKKKKKKPLLMMIVLVIPQVAILGTKDKGV